MGNYHARCGAGEKPEVATPEAYLSLFGQIPEFDQKLATIRKYNISCSIIIQAVSQLQEIYDKKWNTIAANCDTKIMLGSSDTETIEWLMKFLGKKTTIVQNLSVQSNGTSESYNKSSIELLTSNQIQSMDGDECLVLVRGVAPYYGKKFKTQLHPEWEYAQKTKGTFIIKGGGEITKTIPWHLRNKTNVVSGSINGSTPEIEEKKSENTPDPSLSESAKDRRERRRKLLNKARKENAKEEYRKAQETLEEKDERNKKLAEEAASTAPDEAPEPSPEMIQELIDSFGIKMDDDEETIKEKVRTMMQVNQYSGDTLKYIASNC